MGLLRPALDAHHMGPQQLSRFLTDCGLPVFMAPDAVKEAMDEPWVGSRMERIGKWVLGERLTILGYSDRLDPRLALRRVETLVAGLVEIGAFSGQGGALLGLAVAGLPELGVGLGDRMPQIRVFFKGGEGPSDVVARLGGNPHLLPPDYQPRADDLWRLAFGRDVVEGGLWKKRSPAPYGIPTPPQRDDLWGRVQNRRGRGYPPLLRAHVGPFLEDAQKAVEQFAQWVSILAQKGMLHVLSIGSSQLTQSRFGLSWEGFANGGGVPLRNVSDLRQVKRAAGNMLVRTYSGTRNVLEMARLHEAHLDIAWHAFSFWWFNRLDGRGEMSLLENLKAHLSVLPFLAETGKPMEPNVAHHFSFRGCDDASSLLATLMAILAARKANVPVVVIQVMMHTPRGLWGIQDLAKARAILSLARELEGPGFRVIFQPRAGLDHFSTDPQTARHQLAAAATLMDDVEPHNPDSPEVIHVVSYSEGYALADPEIIDESLRITAESIEHYRMAKKIGGAPSWSSDPEIEERKEKLVGTVCALWKVIKERIPHPLSAEGMHEAFRLGFFPVPDLSHDRDLYPMAVNWTTGIRRGAMEVLGSKGEVMSLEERLNRLTQNV